MRRRKFVQVTLAGTPLLVSGMASSVHPRESKGFIAKAGEGRIHGHIQLKGVNSNIIDVKVSGKDTNGDLAIFEQTSLSPKRGTPLHVHPSQDETFYVLQGEYKFQVGKETYHLKTGDSIFLPRNVPHAWSQLSERGKMTVILQPAGKLEEFFVTMAALDHTPTPEELAKIFAANEMKVVGPPLKIY
jgi:quercetin dioxygenase-like cupin family protein